MQQATTTQIKPNIVYYPTLLEQVYRHFTNGNETMNLRQFLRFANDTGIMDRRFSKSAVGFMFAKTTDQKVRRLNFNSWKNNFGLIADKKGLDKNDIVKLVEAFGKKKYFSNPFDFVKYPPEPQPRTLQKSPEIAPKTPEKVKGESPRPSTTLSHATTAPSMKTMTEFEI